MLRSGKETSTFRSPPRAGTEMENTVVQSCDAPHGIPSPSHTCNGTFPVMTTGKFSWRKEPRTAMEVLSLCNVFISQCIIIHVCAAESYLLLPVSHELGCSLARRQCIYVVEGRNLAHRHHSPTCGKARSFSRKICSKAFKCKRRDGCRFLNSGVCCAGIYGALWRHYFPAFTQQRKFSF